MISISIREAYKLGRTDISLLAEGHAGYADPGQPDIVCAGISTLLCTLEACLRDLEDSGGLRITDYERNEQSGLLRITATDVMRRDRLEGIVYAVLRGCIMIENQYPEHVRVQYTSSEA